MALTKKTLEKNTRSIINNNFSDILPTNKVEFRNEDITPFKYTGNRNADTFKSASTGFKNSPTINQTLEFTKELISTNTEGTIQYIYSTRKRRQTTIY